MPLTVAFLVASIYAVAISGDMPLKKRIDTYSRGAGASDLLLMLWIYVLAGAFASSAKAIDSIDATVNLTLSVLPANLILPGLFLAACFVSISIGTSVGTVVALVPIAAGIASQAVQTRLLLPLSLWEEPTSAIISGFISDTTVVATQTQHCKMSDKFRVNVMIVAPAALLILAIYAFLGANVHAPAQTGDVNIVKVLPYIVVLVTAIIGMNVMVVLSLGIILCGIIGLIAGDFGFYGWFIDMNTGIIGMGEMVIIAMMAGGMLGMIKRNGGIDYIIERLTTASTHGAEPRWPSPHW